MSDGKPHVGASLGNWAYTKLFVKDKVEIQTEELLKLLKYSPMLPILPLNIILILILTICWRI